MVFANPVTFIYQFIFIYIHVQHEHLSKTIQIILMSNMVTSNYVIYCVSYFEHIAIQLV